MSRVQSNNVITMPPKRMMALVTILFASFITYPRFGNVLERRNMHKMERSCCFFTLQYNLLPTEYYHYTP